jgi:hypothetical protein
VTFISRSLLWTRARSCLTQAGVHPNASALVYGAARAPDAGYTALAELSDTAGPGGTIDWPAPIQATGFVSGVSAA